MKYIFLLITFLINNCLLNSQKPSELNFKSIFNKYDVNGYFVLYNQSNNEYIRYNPNLCDSGYIPASIFKIPHALIALEEGLVKDTNEIIKWDGHEWPHKQWNKDQTLNTAIKYSCIWVFFEFAEKLGIEKYYEYINDFNYGNKVLTGPPTRFWLTGKFRISANQQIEFLRKFYNYKLNVSEKSINLVKEMILQEENESYKLYYKTGAGRITDTVMIMWNVGFIEINGNTHFFALNFISDDYNKTKNIRIDLLKDLFTESKIIL